MSETRHPRQTKQLAGKDLGDEYLFYDADGDRVHVLNGSARWIYLRCDGKASVFDVARGLASHFALDDETARTDTNEALRGLEQAGLIEFD